jgi:hypothetical protein
MALLAETRELLSFLRRNPAVRDQIAAGPDATILYSGRLIKPAWREIEDLKLRYPYLRSRRTLPEVLRTIPLVAAPFPNLLDWAQSLDSLVPWNENGFIGWRALSGIFASNAVGAVSFVVGSGITVADKVFAATEVSVLLRNPQIDSTTRDLLEYYERCIKQKRADIGVSFIPA